MHGRTDNVKTVYPPQTKFAGGIKIWNTTRVSNSFDPNKVVHFVWKDLGPNYLQMLSTDKKACNLLSTAPLCDCGQEQQTTEHILQQCQQVEQRRKSVWPK